MRETNQLVDSRSDDSHGIKLGAFKKEIVVEWSINHFYLHCNYFSPQFDGKCNENSMMCEKISIKFLEDSLWSGEHRGTRSLPARIWHDTSFLTFIQHCSMNIFPQTTNKNMERYGVWKAWFVVLRSKHKRPTSSESIAPMELRKSFLWARHLYKTSKADMEHNVWA